VDGRARVHHHASCSSIRPTSSASCPTAGGSASTAPSSPGVLPVQGYQSLRPHRQAVQADGPDSMLRVIEPIRDNDEAIRNYGIAQCTQMCQELLQSGQVHGIHFYTLNRDAATIRILKNIGLWREDLPRPLPWQPSANYERWRPRPCDPCSGPRRPTSYVHRTRHWDDYPHGRWGSECAEIGELRDYYFRASKQERLRMWGSEPTSEPDIWRVFASHLSGKPVSPDGVRVTRLPWGDEEPLPSSSESNEAAEARQRLAGLSERGLLATNHLLRVNGASSDHPVHGWGGSGGFVYQREPTWSFSCPAAGCQRCSHGGGRVSFHIADRSGNVNLANFSEPIALTWGVFPASEVAQPTVCDGAAFLAWRDEAFALWTEEWGRLYEEGSPSRRLIESVAETYLLVALVDNDFTEDTVSVLWDLTDQVARRRPTARTRWSSLESLFTWAGSPGLLTWLAHLAGSPGLAHLGWLTGLTHLGWLTWACSPGLAHCWGLTWAGHLG
uniref:Methylenetetrahydrofolate reductase n=1 Tax=Macrostomum lignano TaxID=282301 RepID=A0A1I8FDL2_9PLAT